MAAITITEAERRELVQRAGQYTRPYREVIRAKIVLLAAGPLLRLAHRWAAARSARR